VIVACERCQTRFQLDDARVPDQGIRVRCSRCKHAFVAQRSGAGEDDTIHAIAGAAARDPHKAPPPTSDFEETIRSTKPLVSETPEPPASRAGGSDEEDWTFNEPSAPLSVKPDERGLSRRNLPPLPPPSDESLFAADDAGVIAPPDEPSLDAMGSPENWDFGVADAAEPSPEPDAASPDRSPTASGDGAASLSAPAAPPGTANAATAPAPRASSAATRARFDRVRLASGADALRWGACAVLLAGVAAVSLIPRALPRPTLAAPSTRIGPLVVENARGRLIENAVGGPLLVISATLRNDGSAPARAGAGIAVTLTGVDEDAVPASSRRAPAGVAPDEEALRRDDPGHLTAAIAHSAAELGERTLEPGAALPIGAVFVELPRSLSGIAIESSAATSAASLP
jgi:predicted Zn finger-like uncharacterized protein